MKKTLIALAALAATGAFAQSSVTIQGVLDAGYKSTSAQAAGGNKQEINFNNTATSQFNFLGTEDLGGGMKAGFFFELDVNPTQSSTLNGNVTSTAGAQGQVFTGTSAMNGEQWINLAGGFGELRLGTPNSEAMATSSTSQPFGTAMGSGWSSGFGRLGGVSGLGVNQFLGGPSSNGRIVRHEKVAKYISPNFSGLTIGLEYSFQNDNSSAPAANNNGYTAAGLKYSNGPLNAMYSYTRVAVGALNTATAWTTVGTVNSNTANSDATTSMLAANYNFGATTVYAGMTRTSSNGLATNEDSTSWNVAAKYALNANIDLMGNYLVRSTNLTGSNTPAKLIGLGMDYKLSKRTAAYVRFEQTDTNTNADTGNVDAWAVGLRHNF